MANCFKALMCFYDLSLSIRIFQILVWRWQQDCPEHVTVLAWKWWDYVKICTQSNGNVDRRIASRRGSVDQNYTKCINHALFLLKNEIGFYRHTARRTTHDRNEKGWRFKRAIFVYFEKRGYNDWVDDATWDEPLCRTSSHNNQKSGSM